METLGERSIEKVHWAEFCSILGNCIAEHTAINLISVLIRFPMETLAAMHFSLPHF
jgi:hypothetical protein